MPVFHPFAGGEFDEHLPITRRFGDPLVGAFEIRPRVGSHLRLRSKYATEPVEACRTFIR